jgi:putative transcriptional regulator
MKSDMQKFQDDLLDSVRQMKRGEFSRVTKVYVTEAAKARHSVGMTQEQFAVLLGVSVRTLQDWEQGRREPTGTAKTLLKVAIKHPKIFKQLVA